MRIGRLQDAERFLTQALSAWDLSFARDRAINLVAQAHLRLRQQEVEDFCRLAEEGLALAVSISSPRVVRQVRDLRLDLQPWKDTAPVKGLGEQMVAASCV